MTRQQSSARSQEERRAQTRALLLQAAAVLFARRGVDGVSVDAVAAEAGRTSGAVYAHFGSKSGLLRALLDEGMAQVAMVVNAELETAATPAERLAALWRNVADSRGDAGCGWVALEHEIWSRAVRDPEVHGRVAQRYATVRRQVSALIDGSPGQHDARPATRSDDMGTLVLALLIGLEMQHRLEPGAVSDELALAGLLRLWTPLFDSDHAVAAQAGDLFF